MERWLAGGMDRWLDGRKDVGLGKCIDGKKGEADGGKGR